MGNAAPTQADKGRAFARLHAAQEPFVIANPWDIGSTKILTEAGFAALATTSAGYAMSLGRKDGCFNRDETLAHARQIVGATRLPVSADLESGFGRSPETVAQTIRLAAEAGLVGASIDDASGQLDTPVYDRGLATERIAAAAETVRALPFPFTLVARAENYLKGKPDFDDTLARLQSYESAGADVLYAPGLNDLTCMATICAVLSKPVNIVVGLGPHPHSIDAYAAAGVRRISLGSTLARVAYGALARVGREMLETGSFATALDLALPKS